MLDYTFWQSHASLHYAKIGNLGKKMLSVGNPT